MFKFSCPPPPLYEAHNSEVTVRRLGKIIQRIYFAQLGGSVRTKAWKWSGETRFPGALLLL